MFWTYIIYSSSADKYYIGSAGDVEGRLSAHNHPKNKGWTKRFDTKNATYSLKLYPNPTSGNLTQ